MEYFLTDIVVRVADDDSNGTIGYRLIG